MKHCKTCENCCVDPLTAYLKGFDYHKCVLDGHHIKEPFFEKCEKYKKDKDSKEKSSFLYYLVERVRDYNAKKKR